MPVSPARQLACEILLAVEQEGGYASDLLHARAGGLSPADRRLAMELVLGVLRWRGALDYAIVRGAKRALDQIPPLPRTALRLGAYQLRYLSRVPASAAVHESVELAKADGAKTAGFVNAVLRHLPRAPMAALVANEPNLARRREAEFSHPAWLLARWSRNFSPVAAAAVAEFNNQPPPVAFWPPQPLPDIETAPGRLLRSSRRRLSGELTQTPAFRQGGLWIQDEASQLIAHLLCADPAGGPGRTEEAGSGGGSGAGLRGPRAAPIRSTEAGGAAGRPRSIEESGAGPWGPRAASFRSTEAGGAAGRPRLIEAAGRPRSILDVCAAPGSKTGLLRALAPEALLLALDRHPRRAALLAHRLRRHHVPGVGVVVADAAKGLPLDPGRRFDRILVDAPCTGTGTLARNPEIRWRLQPGDPARLAVLQRQILQQAAARLAPGGRLIYSVCSIEPEEGPEVVAAVLAAQPGLRCLPMAEVLADLQQTGELVAPPAALTSGPWLRLLPGVWATDGFFAACLTS